MIVVFKHTSGKVLEIPVNVVNPADAATEARNALNMLLANEGKGEDSRGWHILATRIGEKAVDVRSQAKETRG